MNGVLRAIQRWLFGDRIRTGLADGAIYWLRPTSVVVLRDRSLEIVRRRVASSASGPTVVYDCDSDSGTCQLRAELPPSGPRLVLVDGANEVLLAVDDVQMFLRRG